MALEEAQEEDPDGAEGDEKKRVKRKMAIVIGFIGTRYRGLMINPEVEASAAKQSVEELVRVALVKAKIVSELNSQKLEQKVNWSRSSRTDAGVSALRLVISARLCVNLESLDETGFSQELVDEINEGLPVDIRCFSAKKVPNSFDAKHACSWREYEYILPTQLAQPLASDGLAPEELAQRLQDIMQRFEGCHSFHNFTRLKASDCLPREQREKGTTERGEEGSKGGKGKGKEKKSKEKKGKGKGKSKGKDQRGKKRKADVLEAEIDAPETSEVGDTIEPMAQEVVEEPMAQESEEVSKPESPLEDVENSAQNAPEAEVVEPMKGPWVEVCSKDGDKWKHRPDHVLKHTSGTSL